jgi:two-component SAPR family response regulator
VTLVFDCASSKDTAFFRLSANDKSTGISLSEQKRDLHKGSWINVLFRFDQDDGTIVGRLGSGPLVTGRIDQNYLIHKCPSFVFGPSEDPIMAVRNILISGGSEERSDTLHFWRCCELDGDEVHDFTGDEAGRQVGLEWLAPLHTHWKLSPLTILKSFHSNPPTGTIVTGATGTIDISRSEVVLFDSTRLITISLRDGRMSARPVATEWLSQFFIDTVSHQYLQMQVGGGKVSVWHTETRLWRPRRGVVDPDSMRYYSTIPFVNPLNKELLLFGGYGWYNTYNALQRFDFRSDSWHTIETTGDRITPRAEPGICLADDSVSLFLFGGFGNESGKQSDGFHAIFDLWRLDLRTYSFTKLWDGGSRNIAWGGMSATRVPGDDKLFVVVREDKVPIPKSYMLAFSPNTKEYSFVADTVKEIGLGECGFDRYNNQFISLASQGRGRDSVEFFIRTLAYPPLSEEYLRSSIASLAGRRQHPIPFLIGAAVLLALVGGGLYFRYSHSKRKVNSPSAETYASPALTSDPTVDVGEKLTKNHIQLFGQFAVHDRDGIERSKEFSPKLRELFLLILLHSGGNGRKKISTDRLTVLLWKDLDKAAAKNVRGVTVNRLREFLASVGLIELSHSEKTWKISLDDGFSCDYFDFERLKELIRRTSGAERPKYLEEFANIVKVGVLLPEDSYEWLDGIKAEIFNETVSVLTRELSLLDFERYPTVCLSVADAIAAWDPLNEEVLRRRVLLLKSLGQHGLAQSAFDAFCTEYQKMYDKPLPSSLSEFLSK